VTMIHLILVTTGATLYCILLHREDIEILETDRVIEVGSLEEAYTKDISQPTDLTISPPNSLFFICFSFCLPGIITSLLLIEGVRRNSPFFLLPWLIFHVIIIIGCFSLGLYLVILFSLLSKEKYILGAVSGLAPILVGIILILLWLPVDQLYIRLRRSSRLVIELTPSLGGRSQSRLSLSGDTLRSMRSEKVGLGRKSSNRSGLVQFPLRLEDKSHSLELILGSQSSSSLSGSPPGSILFPIEGSRTLPRLRRCQEEPNTFTGGPAWKYTDTLRSCKSLASVKSVSIHPEVTEFQYTKEDPSLPGVDWLTKLGERNKGMTRDQIISFYCTQGDVAL